MGSNGILSISLRIKKAFKKYVTPKRDFVSLLKVTLARFDQWVFSEGLDIGRGPFKKYVTSLGGRGSRKIVTNSDKGGGGQAKQ